MIHQEDTDAGTTMLSRTYRQLVPATSVTVVAALWSIPLARRTASSFNDCRDHSRDDTALQSTIPASLIIRHKCEFNAALLAKVEETAACSPCHSEEPTSHAIEETASDATSAEASRESPAQALPKSTNAKGKGVWSVDQKISCCVRGFW